MATGRIARRLAAAIALTALVQVGFAIFFSQKLLWKDDFVRTETGEHLDEALGLYQELARAEKSAMRSEAAAMALRPDLVRAASGQDPAATQRLLAELLPKHADLVSLSVVRGDRRAAFVDRGRPLDETRENSLEVRRPLGKEVDDDSDDDAPALVAVFAADKAHTDGLEKMSDFVDLYKQVSARRQGDQRAYLLGFAVTLCLSIVASVTAGFLLARNVSTRIVRLADATRRVGAGDLTTRVAETGADEVGDLARAFNRMLAEIEATRARIEYLQRIGAWQEMARRLAHEIKNPLTPIQLAVEEIHERYSGEDGSYRKLLDATLEVVEAEVGTLRRLVGEFSDFARLPQAILGPADLSQFLREQASQTLLAEEPSEGAAAQPAPRITVAFDIPDKPASANLDRQMLRRALINLIRNSAQAIRDQSRSEGKVRVSLHRSGDFWVIDVDDDGPGIPADSRERIFDPYVTTKHDGTGLGLAIVKKVVVEHGGVISAHESPLGGARVRVTIPAGGSAPSAAVLEADNAAAESGTARATAASQESA
ncbi:MAG TPA: ATP-binding protein [Polyangiaceae bacterium]|jgi:nitrogen fixation/metabolism regulation signal transduction histidine kinase|nr:ATP-binding protein [Polyangiaceae bacterium]